MTYEDKMEYLELIRENLLRAQTSSINDEHIDVTEEHRSEAVELIDSILEDLARLKDLEK